MAREGFDNQKYLEHAVGQHIRERIDQFGGKLYLEFGGKLFDDFHASRVLPGFEPDSKIRMLQQLQGQAEIVIVINAGDIEKNKVRGDLGITYDADVLRLIDAFRGIGPVCGQRGDHPVHRPGRRRRLPASGWSTWGCGSTCHYPIAGLPPQHRPHRQRRGLRQERLYRDHPPPGGGHRARPGQRQDGHLPVSQLYHEYKRGVKAGYAKFETFPIWNLPLKHPVNLAYEAATADLDDVNMIDPFHLEAYGETTVNYNRDVEIFPVLAAIFEKITGELPLQVPHRHGGEHGGQLHHRRRGRAARPPGRRSSAATTTCPVRPPAAARAEDDAGVQAGAADAAGRASPPPSAPWWPRPTRLAEETGEPAAAIQLPDGRHGHRQDLRADGLLRRRPAQRPEVPGRASSHEHASDLPESPSSPSSTVKVHHLGIQQPPAAHRRDAHRPGRLRHIWTPRPPGRWRPWPIFRAVEAHCSVILSPADEGTYRKLGIQPHLRAQVSDQQALSPISAKRRPREKDLPGALVLF